MSPRTPEQRDALAAQPACEETPRPRDGSQAWVGLVIVVVAALLTAAALAYAVWRWA